MNPCCLEAIWGNALFTMHANLPIKKILIGINITDLSRLAFYTGLTQAAAYGAETWVLHVAEPIRAFDFAKKRYVETKETIERLEEGVQARLDELWSDGGLESVDRRKVHLLVRGAGKASQEIVDTAIAKEVDLIVIGAGTGPTAEIVVRNAPCSVLSIRPPRD